MKINGQKIEGPNVEVIVIPRAEGKHIVFKAKAVLDYDGFNRDYPIPAPPKSQKPGGIWFENPEDPNYKDLLDKRASFHTDWMILESLSATPGLEWETVDKKNHETWANWREELKNSGFNVREVNMIFEGVWRANSLDEKMVKEARESFFRSQQAASR